MSYKYADLNSHKNANMIVRTCNFIIGEVDRQILDVYSIVRKVYCWYSGQRKTFSQRQWMIFLKTTTKVVLWPPHQCAYKCASMHQHIHIYAHECTCINTCKNRKLSTKMTFIQQISTPTDEKVARWKHPKNRKSRKIKWFLQNLTIFQQPNPNT